MMKSVFWWRKPEHPEETTDPWQVTDETFHTYGLCPVRGLNLGRSGVKQSELRRDESGTLAHQATTVPLLPQEADVQKVRTYTVETVKGLLKDVVDVDALQDPIKKALVENTKIAYQAGKGTKRLVLVLIPKDMVDGIRKLADENLRNDVGVQKNNVYLFPSTQSSEDHVSSWHATNHVSRSRNREPFLAYSNQNASPYQHSICCPGSSRTRA